MSVRLGATEPAVADDTAERVPRLSLDVIGFSGTSIRDVVGLEAPGRLEKPLLPFALNLYAVGEVLHEDEDYSYALERSRYPGNCVFDESVIGLFKCSG